MIETQELPHIQDKVINGVLHYREGDSCKWRAYSQKELTEMYLREQESFEMYMDEVHRVADSFCEQK